MPKPVWMDRKAWAEFNALHPVFRCVSCGEDDPAEASVDHILARVNGGRNAASELQWMCRRCNSRKGPRDDAYWGQNLYFDNPVNLAAARVAQRRECFDRVLHHKDWFTRPFSEISGVLYVLAWIVGGGKTLAIPTLGFALNHLIRRDRGTASPRVDRVLVLCKEQSIRDQIADDLARDVTGFGLCSVPPRVGVVTSGSTLDEPQSVDRKDVWAACVHMLFEKNGQPRHNLESILSGFKLIVFDEPHYATEQVLRIVQAASSSLCFGLTGSPITATGGQIKRFVLFSLYDYHSACEYDRSLKYVAPPEEDLWADVFEEVDIDSAVVHRGGKDDTVTDTTRVSGYPLNVRPAITVAESVVRYVHECDRSFPEGFFLQPHRLAPHRLASSDSPDLLYPVHALIQAETIDIGEMIAKHLNSLFESDRARYPLAEGYACGMVRCDTEDSKGQKLTTNHPWLAAKHNGGALSPTSARFLVAVGMIREGVHNPLCGVVGIACGTQSMVDLVQRAFGRQLRAFVRQDGGTLRVPPDTLDSVKIISHSAFGNRPFVEAAVRYILGMGDALADIPTMASLVEGDGPHGDPEGVDPESALSSAERFGIAALVGRQKDEGLRPADYEFIAGIFGGGTPTKEKKVREWAKTVDTDPFTATKSLGLTKSLEEVPRVMLELPTFAPSDDTLVRFIKREHPNLARCCADLELYEDCLATLYQVHAKRFHRPDLPVSTKLSTIHRQLACSVRDTLKGHFTGKDDRIFKLAGTAIRMTIGVQDGESFSDGGKYDTPECHVILCRPEVRRDMRGWMIRALIANGYCPNLASALAITEEVEVAADV